MMKPRDETTRILLIDVDRRTRERLTRYLESGGYDVAGARSRPKAGKKNPHAAALGRLGGLKGGQARAASLSPRQRRAIARKAARARWAARRDV